MIEFDWSPKNPRVDEHGTVTSAEDWLGNRFHVGDRVVYCIGAGRGQMMAIGVVKAMRLREWPSWITDREPVVEVQVLTAKTSGHWDNKARTRPAWVNEMNVTAVSGFEDYVKNF